MKHFSLIVVNTHGPESSSLLMHVLFCLNYFALLKPSASVKKGLMWHIRSVYINSMDVMENVRVRTRHKPLLS